MNKDVIRVVVFFVIVFGVVAMIASTVNSCTSELSEHGLKATVEEVWCGEKGCN